MFSSMDKAIAAIIGAALTLAAQFGLNVEWATPELITTIGGVVTALLVYVIPNRQT